MDPAVVTSVIIKVMLENTFDMSTEQFKDELMKWGQDVNRWLKPAMQKCLTKMFSDKGSGEPVTELQLRIKQLELEDKVVTRCTDSM